MDEFSEFVKLVYNLRDRVENLEIDYQQRKQKWEKIAFNFNARNDRISETPNAPKINYLKHGLNDDGSINLTLGWDYKDYKQTKQNADNIDGFLIYLREINSTDENKSVIYEYIDSRKFTIVSIPPKSYEIGIQAVRYVDKDINENGVVYSELVTFPAYFNKPEKDDSNTYNITINTHGSAVSSEKLAKQFIDGVKRLGESIPNENIEILLSVKSEDKEYKYSVKNDSRILINGREVHIKVK
jgi:hypothetical protein